MRVGQAVTRQGRHKRRLSEEWWRQEGKVQTDLWATEITSINQEDEGRNIHKHWTHYKHKKQQQLNQNKSQN